MRIWHDDIRKPPSDGWVWARTNREVRTLLNRMGSIVTEISLDHDLGLERLDPDVGFEALTAEMVTHGETGHDLVLWMVAYNLVPRRVTIHSWNPAGALRMAHTLNDAGFSCIIAPFQVPKELRLQKEVR